MWSSLTMLDDTSDCGGFCDCCKRHHRRTYVSRRHAWVNKQRGEGTINRFAHFSLPLQRQSGLSSAPTKRSRYCADCFRPVINLLNHTLMTYTHLTSSKCIPKFVIVTRLQGYRMMEAVSAFCAIFVSELQRCTEISPTTTDVSKLIVIRTAAGGRGTCWNRLAVTLAH